MPKQQIQLDEQTAKRVNDFTKIVGISTEYFLSKIANEWLDDKGEYTAQRVAGLRRDGLGRKTRSTRGHNQAVETRMVASN